MGATGADAKSQNELDAVGPVTADGVGTFSGFADLNWLSSGTAAVQSPKLTVSGAFAAAASGVFSGSKNTITGLDVTKSTNADLFT